MIKLIQGDCLEKMKEIESGSIDLILTDPPYGIGESKGKNKSRGKLAISKDYGVKAWDDNRPNEKYFKEMLRISKNQIIFGGNYFADLLPATSCWIVWDKDNGKNDFADCELAWTSFKSAVRYFKYKWNGMLQGNMSKKEKRVHPTQKPLPLMEWIISKYSKEKITILDPFMGSGTTGVACCNLNRNFIGIEKDPEYFKIAEKRIESAKSQLNF